MEPYPAADNLKFDIYGNHIDEPEQKKEVEVNCCYIPSCDTTNCYDYIRCGYQCSQGNYRVAKYSATPGYRLRDSYRAYKCYFNSCAQYLLTCDHCPDPYNPSFSYYTVREDCRDCYYKKDEKY